MTQEGVWREMAVPSSPGEERACSGQQWRFLRAAGHSLPGGGAGELDLDGKDQHCPLAHFTKSSPYGSTRLETAAWAGPAVQKPGKKFSLLSKKL